tara:strand:+ start:101 stop:262 length:162 start_codon:yes stop_codon:yes gene_type:complete
MMTIIIAACLILITVALLFGSDSAAGLLGCVLQLVFWAVIIGVIGMIVIIASA